MVIAVPLLFAFIQDQTSRSCVTFWRKREKHSAVNDSWCLTAPGLGYLKKEMLNFLLMYAIVSDCNLLTGFYKEYTPRNMKYIFPTLRTCYATTVTDM